MFRSQISTIRTASLRLITRCPRATDTRLAKQCTSNNETILSRIPVFDVNTGFNYKNLYCAVCHNVDTENMKIWPPIFDTGCACTLGERGCEAKRDLIEVNQCEFYFDWKNITDCTVTSQVVDTCLPKFSNMSKLCASSAMSIVVEPSKSVFSPTTLYRNMHCAICNDKQLDGASCNPNFIQHFGKSTMKVLSSSLNISSEALIEAKETASRLSKHVMNRSTKGKRSELHVIHVAFLLCSVFYMQQFLLLHT